MCGGCLFILFLFVVGFVWWLFLFLFVVFACFLLLLSLFFVCLYVCLVFFMWKQIRLKKPLFNRTRQ